MQGASRDSSCLDPDIKGILNDMGGSVVACYDNTGMVFAVGCSATQTVSLYACQQADSVSTARRLSCAHR